MKTLKQWYDSLSESTQLWIDNNCKSWFDKNQADYYRKPSTKINENGLDWYLNSPWNTTDSDYSNTTEFVKRYVKTMKYLADINVIKRESADDAILAVIKSNISQKRSWLYLSDEKKKAGFTLAYGKSYYNDKLELHNYLYLIDDFDNINIDLEKCIKPTLTKEVIEIIGMDNARKIAETMDTYDLRQAVKWGKDNALIDELLFCEASNLTQAKKRELIAKVYWDNSYIPNEDSVADFFKRIVAVDHSYLRYFINIVHQYPAIAMKLYTQKKPAEELTGNESVAETFRYSKELRKLFVIAHMCELKNMTKNKASIAKEVAPLLKIYGYNWNEIYDAMYPEDAI